MLSTKKPKHDHNLCIKTAIAAAERLCQTRGVQLTPIRHKVLELILTQHQAVKAYDLLDQMKLVNDTAKPATIYRALDFLLEQGLIHRVASLNAFVGCHSASIQHEQLLLICSVCHTIEEITTSELVATLANELKNSGFTATQKTIEIQGICRNCRVSPES